MLLVSALVFDDLLYVCDETQDVSLVLLGMMVLPRDYLTTGFVTMLPVLIIATVALWLVL